MAAWSLLWTHWQDIRVIDDGRGGRFVTSLLDPGLDPGLRGVRLLEAMERKRTGRGDKGRPGLWGSGRGDARDGAGRCGRRFVPVCVCVCVCVCLCVCVSVCCVFCVFV